MKKNYANPTLRIVSMVGVDIVTASPNSMDVSNETVVGGQAQSKQRGNSIWGDD